MLAVQKMELDLDVELQLLATKGAGSGMVAFVLPLNIKPKNEKARWTMDVWVVAKVDAQYSI